MYNITVEVIEAAELESMDITGTAHPFCTVKLTSHDEVFKTKTIKRSLSPKWGELFTFSNISLEEETQVVVTCYDWELFGSNDFMGQVVIPLEALKNTKYTDNWFPLAPKEGHKEKKKQKGKIHLRVALVSPRRKSSSSSGSGSRTSSATHILAKNHSEPVTSSTPEKSHSQPHIKTTDKQELARQQVIWELISTEEQYVEDLRLIVDLFLSPMRNFLTKQEIGSIFANIEAILDFHEELLVQLHQLKKDKHNSILGIAKPLLEKVDMLKFYAHFCSNQPTALSKLEELKANNQQLVEFLEESHKKIELRNLDIGAFLIKPLQRLCKYPLLLRELQKSTDAKHPEYDEINNAHKKIAEIVDMVNERTRKVEQVQKLMEIQNHLSGLDGFTGENGAPFELLNHNRRFIKESGAKLVSKSAIQTSTHVHVFLFSDVLIISKSLNVFDVEHTKNFLKTLSQSSSNTHKYNVTAVILLKDLLVNFYSREDEEDSGLILGEISLMFGDVLEIVHEGFHIYPLQMQSKKEKNEWISELKTLMKDNTKTWLVERTAKSPSTSEKRQLLDIEMKIKIDMETEIARLKGEIEEIRAKNKTLKTALKLKDGKPELVSSGSMADMGDWIRKKDTLKKKLQDAETARDKFESENKELKIQREEMDDQLKKARAEITKLKERVAKYKNKEKRNSVPVKNDEILHNQVKHSHSTSSVHSTADIIVEDASDEDHSKGSKGSRKKILKELEQVKAENKSMAVEREVMQNHIKSLEETLKLYMHMSSSNLV